MGAVAEFERSLTLERQGEGVALAKQAGKYKGRKAALKATPTRQPWPGGWLRVSQHRRWPANTA